MRKHPAGRIFQEFAERYTLLDKHATGGMGQISLYRDEFLGRVVALKELLVKGEKTSLPGVSRFVREARITGHLEHPSIIPVHELGVAPDGLPYYTMKFVQGQSLSDAIKDASGIEGRLKLLSNFLSLAQAIAYAHRRGVIHRDIKPDNVMVGEFGETVVLDASKLTTGVAVA